MDKEYFSNNYQEGIFEPTDEQNKEEKMVEINETPTGNTERKTRYYTSSIAPAIRHTPYAYANVQRSSTAENFVQVVYTIGAVVNILLAVRLLFKLVGASTTGFVAGLYRLTEPIVAPFQGILPNSTVPKAGFLEIATVMGLVAVTLITFALAAIIKSTTENY